jgi:cytidine deaminase
MNKILSDSGKVTRYIEDYGLLTAAQKELVDAAAEATKNAFAPHSHFLVGAAIKTKAGLIVPGSNYESSSYGLTICAERAAIFDANNHKIRDLEMIAIVTAFEDRPTEEPSFSCGACRQLIYDASQIYGTNIGIITSNTSKSKIFIATIRDLMPWGFGPVDLGVDVKKYRT